MTYMNMLDFVHASLSAYLRAVYNVVIVPLVCIVVVFAAVGVIRFVLSRK